MGRLVGGIVAVLDYPGRGALAAPDATARSTDGSLSVDRPGGRWQTAYLRRALILDAGAAVVAAFGAYLVRWGTERHPGYLLLASLFPLLWVAVVAANRGYEARYLVVGSEEFRRVGRAALAVTALVTFAAYLLGYELSRRFVLITLPAVAALSLAGRFGLRKWLHHRRSAGDFLHRVVVVGHEGPVVDLLDRLGEQRYHGLHIVGACLPVTGQRVPLLEAGIPVIGGYDTVAHAVRLTGADTVAVLAAGDLGPEQLRRLAWDLEPTGADLLVAPSLVEVAGPRLSIRPVSGLPLLHVEQPSFSGGRRYFKSVFDRLTAAAALVLLSPLLLVVALAIRIDSPGPAIFKQERIGKDGRPFRLYKFRSMVVDAEAQRSNLLEHNDRDGLMFKMHADPRITRVGGWIRRYSIDELPQLVNVAVGQMSLVGPRPPLPDEVEKYADHVRRRLLVRPGLTGLWQVSGRADLSWEESIRLDLRYVDNWSFALDLQILWKTGRAVLGGSGAY